MYDTDIPTSEETVNIRFQFYAKNSYGKIEIIVLVFITFLGIYRKHKIQGSIIDNAIVYLGKSLFAEGKPVSLSGVRSLDSLCTEDLDCKKLFIIVKIIAHKIHFQPM